MLDGDICSMKENLMHLVTDTFKYLNNKIVNFLMQFPEFLKEDFCIS